MTLKVMNLLHTHARAHTVVSGAGPRVQTEQGTLDEGVCINNLCVLNPMGLFHHCNLEALLVPELWNYYSHKTWLWFFLYYFRKKDWKRLLSSHFQAIKILKFRFLNNNMNAFMIRGSDRTWLCIFLYSFDSYIDFQDVKRKKKGPSPRQVVRLWRLFSTSSVCTFSSGLCLVGLEASCLHVHTLTGFWSYSLMSVKQRADQNEVFSLLWAVVEVPATLPSAAATAFRYTHKHTPSCQAIASDILTAIWWVFKSNSVPKQEISRKGSVRASLACTCVFSMWQLRWITPIFE